MKGLVIMEDTEGELPLLRSKNQELEQEVRKWMDFGLKLKKENEVLKAISTILRK